MFYSKCPWFSFNMNTDTFSDRNPTLHRMGPSQTGFECKSNTEVYRAKSCRSKMLVDEGFQGVAPNLSSTLESCPCRSCNMPCSNRIVLDREGDARTCHLGTLHLGPCVSPLPSRHLPAAIRSGHSKSQQTHYHGAVRKRALPIVFRTVA